MQLSTIKGTLHSTKELLETIIRPRSGAIIIQPGQEASSLLPLEGQATDVQTAENIEPGTRQLVAIPHNPNVTQALDENSSLDNLITLLKRNGGKISDQARRLLLIAGLITYGTDLMDSKHGGFPFRKTLNYFLNNSNKIKQELPGVFPDSIPSSWLDLNVKLVEAQGNLINGFIEQLDKHDLRAAFSEVGTLAQTEPVVFDLFHEFVDKFGVTKDILDRMLKQIEGEEQALPLGELSKRAKKAEKLLRVEVAAVTAFIQNGHVLGLPVQKLLQIAPRFLDEGAYGLLMQSLINDFGPHFTGQYCPLFNVVVANSNHEFAGLLEPELVGAHEAGGHGVAFWARSVISPEKYSVLAKERIRQQVQEYGGKVFSHDGLLNTPVFSSEQMRAETASLIIDLVEHPQVEHGNTSTERVKRIKQEHTVIPLTYERPLLTDKGKLEIAKLLSRHSEFVESHNFDGNHEQALSRAVDELTLYVEAQILRCEYIEGKHFKGQVIYPYVSEEVFKELGIDVKDFHLTKDGERLVKTTIGTFIPLEIYDPISYAFGNQDEPDARDKQRRYQQSVSEKLIDGAASPSSNKSTAMKELQELQRVLLLQQTVDSLGHVRTDLCNAISIAPQKPELVRVLNKLKATVRQCTEVEDLVQMEFDILKTRVSKAGFVNEDLEVDQPKLQEEQLQLREKISWMTEKLDLLIRSDGKYSEGLEWDIDRISDQIKVMIGSNEDYPLEFEKQIDWMVDKLSTFNSSTKGGDLKLRKAFEHECDRLTSPEEQYPSELNGQIDWMINKLKRLIGRKDNFPTMIRFYKKWIKDSNNRLDEIELLMVDKQDKAHIRDLMLQVERAEPKEKDPDQLEQYFSSEGGNSRQRRNALMKEVGLTLGKMCPSQLNTSSQLIKLLEMQDALLEDIGRIRDIHPQLLDARYRLTDIPANNKLIKELRGVETGIQGIVKPARYDLLPKELFQDKSS